MDIDKIHVENPCNADWDKMTGNEQYRHCQSCTKNVYNLEEYTRDEVKELFETKASPCCRFMKMPDGELITKEVLKTNRYKKHLLALTAAAMLASCNESDIKLKGKPTIGEKSIPVRVTGEAPNVEDEKKTTPKDKDGHIRGEPKIKKAPEDYSKTLDNSLVFLKQDPNKVVIKSIKNADYRFLGIMSYGLSIPGIDIEKNQHYVDKYGFKIIEGTSDLIANDKIKRIMELAPSFCENYNRAILIEFKKKESK